MEEIHYAYRIRGVVHDCLQYATEDQWLSEKPLNMHFDFTRERDGVWIINDIPLEYVGSFKGKVNYCIINYKK